MIMFLLIRELMPPSLRFQRVHQLMLQLQSLELELQQQLLEVMLLLQPHLMLLQPLQLMPPHQLQLKQLLSRAKLRSTQASQKVLFHLQRPSILTQRSTSSSSIQSTRRTRRTEMTLDMSTTQTSSQRERTTPSKSPSQLRRTMLRSTQESQRVLCHHQELLIILQRYLIS